MAGEKKIRVFGAVAALIAVMVSLFAFIYITTHVFKVIPLKYSVYVNAAFVTILVYLVLRIVLSVIGRYLHRYMSPSRSHPIIFLVTIIGYFIIGITFMSQLGINVSSLILGGSIISVIIGLAAQSVLANQFAGILLTIVRPFKIEDYVYINTWQFGGTYPMPFPKYFSKDRIEATGYGGKIIGLTINYTSVELITGDIVKIPNAIVIQSAIIIRKPSIIVQARYEVPKY
ncbi:MAG: mechanosensitive ion channel domain-containing protein, partial [Thermoplasmataceae archaeon]